MGNDDITQELTFLKRLKMAIFKLEDYGAFLGERLRVAFKYFLLLIIFTTIITSLAETIDFSRKINKMYTYIENELPEFTYKDGIVSFENIVEAYDHDYEFRLFIDTSDNVSNDTLKNYKNKIYDTNYGIIVLKDRMVVISNDIELEGIYKDIFDEVDLDIENRNDLIIKTHEIGEASPLIIYFLGSFILEVTVSIITTLADVFLIAVFGYIAARLCGVGFKMVPMIILSIYSISLSVVLRTIYACEISLFGLVVPYFDIMYLLIAYVYIIAAIFIIKYDLIKQAQELQRIIDDQDDIIEEKLEENEDNKKEDKDKDKEDKPKEKSGEKENKEKDPVVNNDNNTEPDGSEI